MPPNTDQLPLVQNLTEDLEDQNISPERLEELCTLLRNSPEARQVYLENMSFAALLQHEARNLDAQDKLPQIPAIDRRQERKAMVRAFSLAAAAIVALAVIAHFILLPKQQPAYASYTLSPGASCTISHASSTEDQPEASITAGTRVNLKSGGLTVKIPGSTTVYVHAPASLHFKSLHEIELHSGELWARSESPEGKLTILTEGYSIEDIGTQFGVLQRPNAPLEVHLIEGAVKIHRHKSEVITLKRPSGVSLANAEKPDMIDLDCGPFPNPFEIVQIDFGPENSIYEVRDDGTYWNELARTTTPKRSWHKAFSNHVIKNSRGTKTDLGIVMTTHGKLKNHSAFALDDPEREFGDSLLDDYLYLRADEPQTNQIFSSVILTGLKADAIYSLEVFASSKLYLLDGSPDYHDTDLRVHHSEGSLEDRNEAGSAAPIVFNQLKPVIHEKYGPVLILDWGWIHNTTDKERDWALLNGLILTEK
ncbi:FecR domain-containing protein [Verrucomicrobiaceae bacterium R5-34]|nr:FecR domain-containing protein [Verrucomicrobiaceae bacterium R5-34]